MKKHISALVHVAITFIMLFGVQQLERSCSVQRSWECEGQIYNLHPTRSRCSSRALNYLKRFLEFPQTVAAGISHSLFLLCYKYHMDLITAKVSNHKNEVT